MFVLCALEPLEVVARKWWPCFSSCINVVHVYFQHRRCVPNFPKHFSLYFIKYFKILDMLLLSTDDDDDDDVRGQDLRLVTQRGRKVKAL